MMTNGGACNYEATGPGGQPTAPSLSHQGGANGYPTKGEPGPVALPYTTDDVKVDIQHPPSYETATANSQRLSV